MTGCRRRWCLRWIALLGAVWAAAVLAGEPNPRVLLRSVGQAADEEQAHEESSSSSSQIQMQQGTQGPESMMEEADGALRRQIAQVMEQLALGFGLTLDTSDLIYISRDDIFIASAGVAGFEDAEGSAALPRVDVGLIYLSREVGVRFGDGERGKRPSGFYAVRITPGSSLSTHDPGITLLELLGDSDTALLSFPIEVLPPGSERKLTASLDLVPDAEEHRACLGWSGRRFTIKLCVTLAPAE